MSFLVLHIKCSEKVTEYCLCSKMPECAISSGNFVFYMFVVSLPIMGRPSGRSAWVC